MDLSNVAGMGKEKLWVGEKNYSSPSRQISKLSIVGIVASYPRNTMSNDGVKGKEDKSLGQLKLYPWKEARASAAARHRLGFMPGLNTCYPSNLPDDCSHKTGRRQR